MGGESGDMNSGPGQPENNQPPDKSQVKEVVSGSEGTAGSEKAQSKSDQQGKNNPARARPPETGKKAVEDGELGSKEAGGSKEAPWERVIRERHSRRTLPTETDKGEAGAKMDPAEKMLIKFENILGETELGKNIRFANELLFHPDSFHPDDLEALLGFETEVTGEDGKPIKMNMVDIGHGLIDEFRNGKLFGRRSFQLLKAAGKLRKQVNASGKKGSDMDVLTGEKADDRSEKVAQNALDALERGEEIDKVVEAIDADQLREEMGLSEQQVKDLASQVFGDTMPAPGAGDRGGQDVLPTQGSTDTSTTSTGGGAEGGGTVPPVAPLSRGEGVPRISPEELDRLKKSSSDWLDKVDFGAWGYNAGMLALILMLMYLGAMGSMARFLERNSERTRAQVQNV